MFKEGKATKCKAPLFIKAYSSLPTTLWQVKLLKKGFLCALLQVFQMLKIKTRFAA
jgi:hypothetical protein